MTSSNSHKATHVLNRCYQRGIVYSGHLKRMRIKLKQEMISTDDWYLKTKGLDSNSEGWSSIATTECDTDATTDRYRTQSNDFKLKVLHRRTHLLNVVTRMGKIRPANGKRNLSQ